MSGLGNARPPWTLTQDALYILIEIILLQWSLYHKAPLVDSMLPKFVCINFHLHYKSYPLHVATPRFLANNAPQNGRPHSTGSTVLCIEGYSFMLLSVFIVWLYKYYSLFKDVTSHYLLHSLFCQLKLSPELRFTYRAKA